MALDAPAQLLAEVLTEGAANPTFKQFAVAVKGGVGGLR
jgi:hypothetical protein